MSIRYIVRPRAIRKTPRLLCEELGATQTLRYDTTNPYFRRRLPLDYNRDFFMAVPATEFVTNIPNIVDYEETFGFYLATKYGQRLRLESYGIPTPQSYVGATKYVVRPHRHMSGRDYRVTTDGSDFDRAVEYIAPLVPKKHEFRLVFVKGVLLFSLLKKTPEDINPEGPWNHASGSTFLTVTNPLNNRVARYFPEFVEKLTNCPVVRTAHIVGVDVMLTSDQAFVSEVNFAPAITLPQNLGLIKEFLLNDV